MPDWPVGARLSGFWVNSVPETMKREGEVPGLFIAGAFLPADAPYDWLGPCLRGFTSSH